MYLCVYYEISLNALQGNWTGNLAFLVQGNTGFL